MTVIPNPPTLGATFLNEVTGVTYEYDGERWIIIKTPGSEEAEQISEDLAALTSRVADGETVQGQIQSTISDALDTQSNIKNSIVELEEEIESLAPSLDRGKWNLATLGAGVTLASGEYAMGIGVDSQYCQEKYLECLEAANNDPFEMSECTRLAGECGTAKDSGEGFFINDWSHADFLHFHKTDSEGKNHTFSDYEVGMFIDLFDQGDTGFAVFEITAVPTLDGDVYTIGVTPIQHEGEALGLARIKIFELSASDPTTYVRKTGDTMTGRLTIDAGQSTGLYVKSDLTGTNSILYVRNGDDDTKFRVTGTGQVQAGNTPSSAFIAAQNNDVTTKKYVDDRVRQYASTAWVPQGRKYRYMEAGQTRYITNGEWGFQNPDWKLAYCSYRDAYGKSCAYTGKSSIDVVGFIKVANPSGTVRAIGRYTNIETGEKNERDEFLVKYNLSSWWRMNESEFTPLSEWWIYDSFWLS